MDIHLRKIRAAEKLDKLRKEKCRCIKCGMPIAPTRKEPFCSAKCMEEYNKGFKPFQTVYCICCGQKFITRTRKVRYCSDECQEKVTQLTVKIKNACKLLESLEKRDHESIAEIENRMRTNGLRYADYQKQETMERLNRRITL